MNWNKVESSNIASVAYDENAQKMFVKFHNGGVYSYDHVPINVYHEIRQADSVGKAFHRLVKSDSGRYPYSRIN